MKNLMWLLTAVLCLGACSNETDELSNVDAQALQSQTTTRASLAESEIYFSVYPSYLNFPGTGGSKSVQVTANIPWQAAEITTSGRGLLPKPSGLMELIYPENPTGNATLTIKLQPYYGFEPLVRKVRIWSEAYNRELFCDVIQEALTPQTECYLDYSVVYAEYYITKTSQKPTYQSKKFKPTIGKLTLQSGTILSDGEAFAMGDALWLWGGMGSSSISLIEKLSKTEANQTYYIGLSPIDPHPFP